MMDQVEIKLFALASGKEPYLEWESKQSKDVQAIAAVRLARIRGGNFGDSKLIGDGFFEQLPCRNPTPSGVGKTGL